MNYLKKLYKPTLFMISFILISVFMMTLLNYINIFSYKLTIYLKMILTIVSFLIGGYMIGIKSHKKGWLEGLKYGLIIIVPTILLSMLFKSFHLKSLIFYSILIISSIIGSMIGINKSKED